jgi:hypothetical protein
MRSTLLKSCLALLFVTTACGEVPEAAAPEPQPLAESTQAVLYPPPAPASGNIADSTAYLGPLAVGGAVQSQFTTNPQYLSFSLQALPGAQVKLEVTHLGSSMYLDTGLFVYGPKDASGSYGTTVLGQDDDAGYGQLSKIASLALPAGGEYLVVVSTGTGAGKRFRLQADCLNGQCAATPAPAGYALALQDQAIPSNLQAIMDRAYWACEGACMGWLRVYSFPWNYVGQPALEMAGLAVEGKDYFGNYNYMDFHPISYPQLEPLMAPAYWPLHAEILSTYWNGTENVQVAEYNAQTSGSDHDLYVILFPESRKVVVYEEDYYW